MVANLVEKSLKFIIDNQDKGVSYDNIPLDEPLVPAIFLYDRDDSVEVEEVI